MPRCLPRSCWAWLPVILFLLAGCRLPKTPLQATIHERDFQAYFARYGVQGCLLLYEAGANRYTAYNLARCRQGFLPASTFKIPNTLIALASGALPDTAEICHWDGVPRAFPQWNRDMTFATALRVSCVPCYQQLARRIGPTGYARWLPKLGYPGMVVTAATADTFWLNGPSRISCFEQIAFLRRLQAETLPVARRHQQAVKALLRLQQTSRFALYGKSGWRFSSAQNGDNGWLVGWLARADGQLVFFALNLEPAAGARATATFASSRRAITEAILHEMGWL